MMIHLFNLAGYWLFFEFFIQRSDEQVIQQVDNHQYNESELLTLKIPLAIPYNTNWSSFERIDGEINVNGIYYNYVGRKFSRDTLYLLCLPNALKTSLHAARNDYNLQVNDLPGNQQNGWHSIKKGAPLAEYTAEDPTCKFTIPATIHLLLTLAIPPALVQIFIDTPFRPPCTNVDEQLI